MIAEKTGRCAAVALAVAACSPALDWREVRPPESGLLALFTCKPDRMQREIPLAGATVTMGLAACSAGGATYALTHARLDDPARVGPALQELRAAAAANVGGTPRVIAPMAVAGMTPNPNAERVEIDGHDARNEPVRVHAGFFVRGMQVYQATVVGAQPDAAAVGTFFSSLKLE